MTRTFAIIVVLVMLASAAMGLVLQRRTDVGDAAIQRLDRHCAFERLQLEVLQTDLQSPVASRRDLAERTFSLLSETDFREVKLCAPEGAPIDPDDRSLMCSVEFNHDRPCMQAIVATMLLYVRGR